MGAHIVKALYAIIEGIVIRLVNAFLRAPLATAVFAIAAVGGLSAVGSWVGTFIGFIINIGPWWTPHLLFVLGVIAVGLDIAREGVAERFAIYGALVVPSFGMAIPKDAKLHTVLAGWIDDVNHWLDKHIGVWIGGTAQHAVLTVVTVCSFGIAIYYCERIAKRNGVSKITASSTSSSNPGSSTRTPGRRVRPSA